ncbi:MAG: hypothetical protein E7673_06755, partial [Ruminococcaceae bacterium]|nr:hypothetical protein [Oscillospiraceae bacterium]
ALDMHGKVLWYNEAMRAIKARNENFIGMDVSTIFDENTPSDIFSDEPVSIDGRIYSVQGFTVSEKWDGLYLVELSDITALSESEKRYNDERVAVAYIAIDNVEDVLQYVHEKFRDAISTVDDKLKSWVDSMNGIIKTYENDKYIVLFDSHYLDCCINDRFSILDEIRETRLGDGVSITVSIGVSRIPGSLADREAAAREAIDLALQRGGDQVVYKSENATEYYGGKTKSVYKRSSVRSRTFTTQLTSAIARADNVIIMGHRYGDFDSFGASVGVSVLCALCGVKSNIAVDMRDKNLSPCINMLEKTDQFLNVFVDNAEGLDLVGPDTLLVLVDHNTFIRSQFADIAQKVDNVAVIDHHRTTEQMPKTVRLSYIEPSASSSCELVSEMLENAISSHNLLKEVADMLLAGVLLDTKQFTRNTGTRTFGVAQYLRGAGASPADVYSMFKTDPTELSKEARFHTAITIYNENIAISCCEGETDESYRIIASKAADKMLSLRGIDAAFTLVRIGEQIHISGRSNGKINVQLILEKLNGGGHFDVAGAQVFSQSVEDVLITLKSSIDDYIETLN